MRRLAVLALLALLARPAAAERAHVYVVVVDGLDPRMLSAEATPTLFANGTPAPVLAVMPTRTNPNHASLLTGTWPQDHGVTGNAYWSRRPDEPVQKLDHAVLLEVETLYTVAERDRPELVTMGAFAKPKLGRLFAAVPERQLAPDVLWVPGPDDADVDLVTRYASDATTMGRLLDFTAEREPDLAVVNLADVDRTAHARGPGDAAVRSAVAGADAALARLVAALRAGGRWQRSIVLVTADHGFDDVRARPGAADPVIHPDAALRARGVRGVRVACDGGMAHVYAEGVAPGAIAPGTAAGTLAKAAAVLAATPGVAQVVARLPVPGVPLLSEVRPGWRLAHERAGDLLAVARPGHQFLEPDDLRLGGNHGGPGEQRVPLAVLGGHPAVAAVAASSRDASLADLGATVAVLLGLRPPRRFDGKPLETPGRPLIPASAGAPPPGGQPPRWAGALRPGEASPSAQPLPSRRVPPSRPGPSPVPDDGASPPGR